MIILAIVLLVILTGLIVFLVWKAFVQNGRAALKQSKDRVSELEAQIALLEEKASSRINVTGLTPVLHVAVLNVDTSFVRPYTREEQGYTFNGALRADIVAEYGVKLEEMKFRLDGNTLYIAGFKPGLISYSRKQLSWDHAVATRQRKLFAPVLDTSADLFAKKMKERLRAELEKEIDDRNIAEFEWLAPVVSRQVTELIKQIAGRPVSIVEVGDHAPEGYIGFEEFCEAGRLQNAQNQLQINERHP